MEPEGRRWIREVKTPVTCARKNATMWILILNVPLPDSQGSATVQNINASLTTKEVAWLDCMTAAVHGRNRDGN